MRADEVSPLFQEVDRLIREDIVVSAHDAEAVVRQVRLLTAAACLMNDQLRVQYGGHPGDNRGVELVEQVVGAAFQTFGGADAHPDAYDKAAMLLRGIVQGHPFGDGNKRTGFALAAYYLNLVGIAAPADDWDQDDVTEFCMAVSAGDIRDVAVIADRLRILWDVTR